MQISPSIQRKIKVATAVTSALLLGATPVFALDANIPVAADGATSITLAPSSTTTGFFATPNDLVQKLLSIIMVIGIILVFAYLVLGGIEYITSGGEKGKTESARNKITSAVIGLIILASSYAILSIVLKFIGYNSANGVISF
ncbi:hypothetical protein BH10PAT2_BH10PAT2_0130 [soil metagenome]